MSTPSTFNHVKAAMAAVLHFNGKSLEDFETDLQKAAGDKDDKSGLSKAFPFLSLPFTLANSAVNLTGMGAQAAGSGLAKLDAKMDSDDKHVKSIEQRKKIVESALAQLKQNHPNL